MSETTSRTYLGVYSDEACTKPINKMDFGRLQLGESYSFKWYMKNHSDKWIIQNIKLDKSLTTDEIKINHPELLLPSEIAQVDLTFKPSLKRRDPLYMKGLFLSELWIG